MSNVIFVPINTQETIQNEVGEKERIEVQSLFSLSQIMGIQEVPNTNRSKVFVGEKEFFVKGSPVQILQHIQSVIKPKPSEKPKKPEIVKDDDKKG
jgi:hypothetical protein